MTIRSTVRSDALAACAASRRRRGARAAGAAAQSTISEASALSVLPIAVSVAAPVAILSAGAALIVVAVEATSTGAVWVLERASDGARASVRLVGHGVAGRLDRGRHGRRRDRAQHRLGPLGGGRGDRLRPERDRPRAALQREDHAMRRRHAARPRRRASRSPQRRPSPTPAAAASSARRARSRSARGDAARRAHRRAADAERRQRRRHRPRRPEPERVRPALFAPRLRLPRGRRQRGRLARRPQAQPVRLGARVALPPGTRRVLPRRPLGYEAAVVVLAPQAQAHLRALLADNAAVARLDTPAYSMVAYPWSRSLPAVEPVGDRDAGARRGPRRRDARSAPRRGCACTATSRRRCTCRRFKRLGARVASANVAFDDHPNEKRFSDRIETVTVDSVFRWLERDGLGGAVQVIR